VTVQAVTVVPERSLFGRVLEMLSFRVAALPLSFLTTIVTSRFLHPDGRGAYVLGLLTVTIAATLIGNATAVTYEVGRRPEEVRAILGRALALSLVLGTVGIGVLLPLDQLMSTGGRFGAVALFPLGLPLLLVSQSIGGALPALGRLRLLNVVQFVPPAALLVGTASAVWLFRLGVRGAVVAWLVTQAVAVLVCLVGARDLWLPLVRESLSLRGSSAFVLLGMRAGVVNLVALVNYRVELMLLEAFRGLHAVGIYSVSVSLAELLWLVSGTLSAVTVAPALAAASDRESGEIVARTLRHTLILTASAGLVLGAVCAFLIPVVFGHAFRGSVLPLLLLVPGAVAYAPASVLSTFFSMRLGRMRYPLVVAGLSAATTAVVCVGLVPLLGAPGAAIASTVGYATGSVALGVMFVRRAGLGLRALVPGAADFGVYRELPRLARKRFA
jgi:O-antigen/teichoic acid export membrane protein